MQWNKYPLRYATWIFIPLRRPPVCPSYPSNICGASLPEAFRLSTSISACYSNNSCSSARSLFSAVLSCNPYFFCRGCKTARSLYHSAFRSVRYSDGSRRKKLPLHSRNPSHPGAACFPCSAALPRFAATGSPPPGSMLFCAVYADNNGS